MTEPCVFCDVCGQCVTCTPLMCVCEPRTIPANAPPTNPPPPIDPFERMAITLDNILGEVRGLRADFAGLASQVNDHEARLKRLENE